MYLFMKRPYMVHNKLTALSVVREQITHPNEIFKLPMRSQAGDLEDKGAVILEQIINLLQEAGVAENTDVL